MEVYPLHSSVLNNINQLIRYLYNGFVLGWFFLFVFLNEYILNYLNIIISKHILKLCFNIFKLSFSMVFPLIGRLQYVIGEFIYFYMCLLIYVEKRNK